MTDDDDDGPQATDTHDPDGVPYGDGAIANIFARPIVEEGPWGRILGDGLIGDDGSQKPLGNKPLER